MSCRKGFTLMEMLVVLFIIGVVVAFFSPGFYTSTQLAYSQAAKNNLLAIYSAQLNHFNDNNGVYCLNNPCADTLAHINANLNLSITDNIYAYNCGPDPAGTPFLCTATNGNTTLKVNDATIVLPGNVNPTCAGTYCPS